MMMMVMIFFLFCFFVFSKWSKNLKLSFQPGWHFQRFSPSQISDTPRAGFKPVQNLSLGFVERSSVVVITNTSSLTVLFDIQLIKPHLTWFYRRRHSWKVFICMMRMGSKCIVVFAMMVNKLFSVIGQAVPGKR